MQESYHRIKKYPESSKLVDIIKFDIGCTSRAIYNAYDKPQETINYLVEECIRKKPIKKTYNNTINFFKRSDDISKSALTGMLGSMIINYAATTIAGGYELSIKQLHDVSYYSEMISYSTISTGIFYYLQRKKGNTFWESMWKLAKFGVAGAIVSATVYKWGRAELSGILMDELEFPQGTAELTSQFANIFPFVLMVDMIGKPLAYINEKTRISETIDKMMNNGNKKNGIHKENAESED